jgi:hypothetical protein
MCATAPLFSKSGILSTDFWIFMWHGDRPLPKGYLWARVAAGW